MIDVPATGNRADTRYPRWPVGARGRHELLLWQGLGIPVDLTHAR